MLNRYGLFDIEKFLREQDEPSPQEPAPAPEAAPAPPPEEDPDEKIDNARAKNQDADLVDFRKRHADLIYQIANAYGSEDRRVDNDTFLRALKQKFDTSGVDQPLFVLFDPETTGLKGPQHLALIAALHHDGEVKGGQVRFHSAGDASSFAEYAPSIRGDISFEVDENDRTVVKVGAQQTPEPESEE